MRAAPWCVPVLLCCAWAAQPGLAQEYSYDGNRWYEVEAIVFRHRTADALVSERPRELLSPATATSPVLPGDPALPASPVGLAPVAPASIGELPLRELISPLAAFQVDFAALEAAPDTPEAGIRQDYGPEPAPGAPGDFRLTDFARDGWIALPQGMWGLARDHQRLEEAPGYDLLWHQAWRQPLLGPAQAPAVAASAETPEPDGAQLGGNIRLLPFNAGTLRVQVDLALRLDTGIWELQEQRELLPDTFHYFDNPAFGLLLRVQPYVLPSRMAVDSSPDF